MPRVFSKKGKEPVPADAVYVGRPSKWGNPYSHMHLAGCVHVATREQAIERYREHLVSSGLIDDVHELIGRDLVCHCTPLPCHADVLLEAAAAAASRHRRSRR